MSHSIDQHICIPAHYLISDKLQPLLSSQLELTHLCVESPFIYLILIVVPVVATELEISGNVNVPPGLGPPIYPTSVALEQPEQERSLAPPERICGEASASGVVSEGPVVQVPATMLRIQFTSLVC